jgi:hypothetical protein
MRSTKRVLRALGLLIVLLSVTSARPTQGYLCNPPYGTCYSECASGSQMCLSASWNGYFCAYVNDGCYGTSYCGYCM